MLVHALIHSSLFLDALTYTKDINGKTPFAKVLQDGIWRNHHFKCLFPKLGFLFYNVSFKKLLYWLKWQIYKVNMPWSIQNYYYIISIMTIAHVQLILHTYCIQGVLLRFKIRTHNTLNSMITNTYYLKTTNVYALQHLPVFLHPKPNYTTYNIQFHSTSICWNPAVCKVSNKC